MPPSSSKSKGDGKGKNKGKWKDGNVDLRGRAAAASGAAAASSNEPPRGIAVQAPSPAYQPPAPESNVQPFCLRAGDWVAYNHPTHGGRNATTLSNGKAISESRKRRMSGTMSRLLRHDPWQMGIKLDNLGRAKLDDFLAAVQRYEPNFRWTMKEILHTVAHDDSCRFMLWYTTEKFNNGDLREPDKIGCSQGHTKVPVHYRGLYGEPLKPDQLPAEMVHHSYYHCLGGIKANGLCPGGFKASKRANHFATDRIVDGIKKAGLRIDAEIELHADVDLLRRKIRDNGWNFYQPVSGCIITERIIPFDHFAYSVDVKTQVTVHNNSLRRVLEQDCSRWYRPLCPNCGELNVPGSQFCVADHCWTPLSEKAKHDLLRSLKRTDPDRFEELRREYLGDKRQRKCKGDKSHLSNQHVNKLIKTSKADGFAGHKDKYRRCELYTKQCDENHKGPIPMRLKVKVRGATDEDTYWMFAESNSEDEGRRPQ